jgi:hypothetical protein
MTSKRTITGTNETAILSKVVRPVYFARLDFASGVERYHTEIGPITATHPVFGAESYTGIGDFGGIEGDVTETVDGVNQTVGLMISGVKAAMINLALTDNFFMRDAEIMLGFMDESKSLLDDPEILYSGFMSTADIALDQGLGQIALTLESRAVKLNRASDWRFTDEDKQIEVNGDLMGEYIYRMTDLQLTWGQNSVDPFRPPSRRRGSGGNRSRSDERLKENIIQIGRTPSGLEVAVWKWNDTARALGIDGPNIGVIAQQAQEICPEAVSEGPHGYLMVDYGNLKIH